MSDDNNDTNTLREEHKKNKERKEQLINEAALSWVKNNIILINERLNRSTIARLTNSIVRFDEKFGPYREKLPAIQDILDRAEMGLQLVLTGKTSDTRAADMLRHLSLVYSLLSDFFAGDLPTLLKTPLFRAARANPDVRLDSITEPGHDPESLMAAFTVALRPSKDELKMLGKIYKNVPLPNLKAEIAAKQLLGLSFNDLVELAGVGKVPMVGVPHQMAAKPEELFPAEETSLSEEPVSEEEGGELLDEQQNAPAKLDNLIKSLGALDAIFSTPGLKGSGLYKAFSNMRKQAATVAAKPVPAIPLPQLFKTPQGRIIAQAEMAMDMFKKLGQLAPAIDTLFKDGEFGEEDKATLLKLINSRISTKGSIFKQIKDVFKVAPFQGLDPASVAKSIENIIEQGLPQEQPAAPAAGATPAAPGATPPAPVTEAAEEQFTPGPQAKARTEQLGKGLNDLKTLLKGLSAWQPMTDLVRQQMQKVGTERDTATAPTAAAGQTQGTTPGQPAPGAPTTGAGPQALTGAQSATTQDLSTVTDLNALNAIANKTGIDLKQLQRLQAQAKKKNFKISIG